ASALEAWAADRGWYPAGGMENLWKKLVPKYVRRIHLSDPWARPYVYRTNGPESKHYVLASAGSDGLFQTSDADLDRLTREGPRVHERPGQGETSTSADLIFCDGAFLHFYEAVIPSPPPLRCPPE